MVLIRASSFGARMRDHSMPGNYRRRLERLLRVALGGTGSTVTHSAMNRGDQKPSSHTAMKTAWFVVNDGLALLKCYG